MYQDTGNVSNDFPTFRATSSSTSGTTQKEAMGSDGTTMSAGDVWLEKEKSFEITNGHIITFSFVLLIVGFIVGAFVQRNSTKVFSFGGVSYSMIGVGEISDNGRKIYAPVYEVKK